MKVSFLQTLTLLTQGIAQQPIGGDITVHHWSINIIGYFVRHHVQLQFPAVDPETESISETGLCTKINSLGQYRQQF